MPSIIHIFLIGVLITAMVIDLKSQRIPNKLTFPSMLIALLVHIFSNGINGLLFSLTGLGIGLIVFLIPYLLGGMGAGDAKLMAVVGAVLGTKGVVNAAILTALFGGMYALIIIALHYQIFKGIFKRIGFGLSAVFTTHNTTFTKIDEDDNAPSLCYGVAIALGTLAHIAMNYYGYSLINL